jgi:hypothetical protein
MIGGKNAGNAAVRELPENHNRHSMKSARRRAINSSRE